MLELFANPPLKRLAEVTGKFRKSLGDMRPAFRAMLPFIIEHVQDELEAGSGWRPLSEAYAKRKGGRAFGVFTGALTSELAAGKGRRSISRKQLRWGPSLKQGYVLNYGRDDVDQPARPWLVWSEGAAETAREIVDDRIGELLDNFAVFTGETVGGG